MHLTVGIIDYVFCSNTSDSNVTYGLSGIICSELFRWMNMLVYIKKCHKLELICLISSLMLFYKWSFFYVIILLLSLFFYWTKLAAFFWVVGNVSINNIFHNIEKYEHFALINWTLEIQFMSNSTTRIKSL